jgi:hypothetical protein
VLLKNVINAGGMSTNSGEIEAQLRRAPRRAGRYEKTKRATSEWESSFAGAVAIPKAQQQYPVLVPVAARPVVCRPGLPGGHPLTPCTTHSFRNDKHVDETTSCSCRHRAGALMTGCAHPISVTSDLAPDKGSGTAKIDKSVGYYIAQEDRTP